MATFLASPPSLTSPLKRLHVTSNLQQPPRTPPSSDPDPSQQQQQQPQPQLSSSSSPSPTPLSSAAEPKQKANRAQSSTSAPDSTDWIASSLSRRFGVGAGLAWTAFLAFGVVSEQVKTRFEAYQQQAQTRDVVGEEEEILLPNGIRYYEMRAGGGSSPMQGDLVVMDLQGRVQGSNEVFVDTFGEGSRPLALIFGSRPYTKGMCEGVEYVLKQRMKAGGKARVIVPPNLGFGEEGADLGSGFQIPPNSSLEFIVQVDKVSIAPS